MDVAEIQREIEFLRNEVRRRGFMSGAQIRAVITERNFVSNKDDLLSLIECKDIRTLTYTNQYLKGLVSRKLYYYIYKNETKR